MKCMLLVNQSSGNAKKAIHNEGLRADLLRLYDEVDEVLISESDRHTFDLKAALVGYDALAVCGGDGTFNTTINMVRDMPIDFLYIPCGTLNESAHTLQSIKGLDDLATRQLREVDLGEFNHTLFSYVAATGSFTPIGFLPKSKHKKVFGRLVYYLYAFKEYRVHRIGAKIETDGNVQEDTFTLIMAVKSKYVFGFPFNKLYKHNDGKGHMLLIRAPKGIFRWVTLFFLFFRTFFVGFKKEVRGRFIQFFPFENATITLDEEQDFCIDGERYRSEKENHIRFHKKKTKMFITKLDK